eukprot:TRINITY_DN48020_c0_g1_i1.p1 TRINITY_DN48020_c0_g1~~TRINITY_DN48020_c0_g1_i1.p1  ORF type:complete len:232 (+),score=43.57 TRINITY_DN48020_c0_g1_i1:47-697(+)
MESDSSGSSFRGTDRRQTIFNAVCLILSLVISVSSFLGLLALLSWTKDGASFEKENCELLSAATLQSSGSGSDACYTCRAAVKVQSQGDAARTAETVYYQPPLTFDGSWKCFSVGDPAQTEAFCKQLGKGSLVDCYQKSGNPDDIRLVEIKTGWTHRTLLALLYAGLSCCACCFVALLLAIPGIFMDTCRMTLVGAGEDDSDVETAFKKSTSGLEG